MTQIQQFTLKKYCRTNGKMEWESQQVLKVTKCRKLAWEAESANAEKK